MPHAKSFRLIEVTELHPTFGAEIVGIDFSQPVCNEIFKEVLAAITKVRSPIHASFTSIEHLPMSSALVRSPRLPQRPSQ